jgi:hypothetical protein
MLLAAETLNVGLLLSTTLGGLSYEIIDTGSHTNQSHSIVQGLPRFGLYYIQLV